MISSRSRYFSALAIGIILLTACSSNKTAENQGMDICAPLAEHMMSMNIDVMMKPEPDNMNSETNAGCTVSAEGSGWEFQHIPNIGSAIIDIFQSSGWEDDLQFAADGPFSTGSGFRKNGDLCLFSASWGPSDDVECPEDRPISDCDFGPDETHVIILIRCDEDMPPQQAD